MAKAKAVAQTEEQLAATSAAVEEICGAAMVLDAGLRVVLATSSVETLLGFEVPRGAIATRLICGESTSRPMAEALAAGRAAQVIIARPTKRDELRKIRVRSVPLGAGRARAGWLLFFEEAVGAASDGPVELLGIWTQDDAMKRMFRVLERVAISDAPVLVRGETGAGKELVASAVHSLSARKNGPFRAINCAALPANLLESELFGHARGAFTGAVRDAPGHFQLAHKGTLFLDEVADMPLELQAKLLRVLETHTVLAVGARQPTPVDVRIVSATHRSLRGEVEAGTFRADLMFRLRVIPVFLPPLRARKGDIALLTQRFIDERNERGTRRIERVAPATSRILEAHDWPGNVRELRNVIEYAAVIGEGPVFAPTDLPPELLNPTFSSEDALPRTTEPVATTEAARILRALERSAGSRERAAKVLGISRVTLWRRMRDLGLSQPGSA